MSTQLNEILGKAFQEFQSGNFSQAEIFLKHATQLAPNHFDALHLLAVVLASQGKHSEAVEEYKSALLLNPDSDSALSNFGSSLNALGLNDQAIIYFKNALSINPASHVVWFNAGNTLSDLKKYKEAEEYYKKAFEIKPDYFEAYYNYAKALTELHCYEESVPQYLKALDINPSHPYCIMDLGVTLKKLMRYEEAVQYFDRAVQYLPEYAEAWLNRANALQELKRFNEAEMNYNKAIALNANYAEAWSNKGTLFQALERYDDAIDCYNKALSLKPQYAEAWSNKGSALLKPKLYEESIECYKKAIELKPSIDWIPGAYMHVKMQICRWIDFDLNLKSLIKLIQSNARATIPFFLLALVDDPSLQRQGAAILVQDKYPANDALGNIPKKSKKNKIRVGYFSADFNNHAVAVLTAELFELHNRERFEVIAFAFGSDDSGQMRSRLRSAFDEFIDISNLTDKDAAQLAREKGIDIAVDLGGFTGGNRMGIFSYRAAPVQVGYIGYLGTIGAPYMDYIIADKTIIPAGFERYYQEKIVYLPSYQVNDSKRKISEVIFTRKDLGLPETGFVFACFNNNYKILPDTFDRWMRILKIVEGSVLFLYAENALAKENLIKEAIARGIASERLVFGGRLSADEYLARYRACDLFLDTAPYNAGTTASDALWAGLPVLTMMGKSFASRVAASLLNAIGLPELITNSPESYEARAIELAQDPEQLASIREKLAKNRLTEPLFDTPLFTKNLESAYLMMYERYQAGLEPDHLVVL